MKRKKLETMEVFSESTCYMRYIYCILRNLAGVAAHPSQKKSVQKIIEVWIVLYLTS